MCHNRNGEKGRGWGVANIYLNISNAKNWRLLDELVQFALK